MGMKILAEDGSLVHEFADGLGAPLLYRVLAAAKFPDGPDALVILNPHVAALYSAIAKTLSRQPSAPVDFAAFSHEIHNVIRTSLHEQVLQGKLAWMSWTADEKRRFVREVLIAPHVASDEFIDDLIEDADSYFECVRRALSNR